MSSITYPVKEERLVRPGEVARNERKAHCAFRWHGPRCYEELSKGEGYLYEDQYYCWEHYVFKVAFDALAPRRLTTQAQIEAWCKENVSLNMGSITADHIANYIWRTGLYCAEVAEAIAKGLPDSHRQYTYVEVMRLVDGITEQVMSEPLIDELPMPEWAEDFEEIEDRLKRQYLMNECEGE